MRRITQFCTLTLVMLLCAALAGCAWIKPTTQIKFNPYTGTISVFNTKDVDVTFKKIVATKGADGSATLEVEDAIISDKSSPVIKENVNQMLAFVEQQRAANEGIGIALQGIGSMIQTLAGATQAILRGSTVAVDTEWGGGSATLGTPTTAPGGP